MIYGGGQMAIGVMSSTKLLLRACALPRFGTHKPDVRRKNTLPIDLIW